MSKYFTIPYAATGEIREKGSKFLAYAFPIRSEIEVAAQVENLRKEHPKARHWCYAWRLGLDKNLYRANDDGEPSGTAGRPILGQIDSAGLTNVLIIVVRYFGGTLLGTSGLIQAYREAAANALATVSKVEKTVCDFYECTFDYALMSDVMNAVKKLDIEPTKKEFTDHGLLEIPIPIDQTVDYFLRFKTLVLKISEEEATLIKVISGIHWRYLRNE